MKPFDLQQALRNQSENINGDPEVVTRDGRKVIQIAHFANGLLGHKVAVQIEQAFVLCMYPETGKAGVSDREIDLFMASKQVTVWVNLYPNLYPNAFYYKNETEADASSGMERVGGKAWPLTYEE